MGKEMEKLRGTLERGRCRRKWGLVIFFVYSAFQGERWRFKKGKFQSRRRGSAGDKRSTIRRLKNKERKGLSTLTWKNARSLSFL